MERQDIGVSHRNDLVVQNTPIPVEELEQRPTKDMDGGPEEEVKVKEECKYASVTPSSINEDRSIDHTASKVS